MTIYVLYHASCQDGLGARYAANKKFGDTATYIPVKYDDPLPRLELGPDTEVYIADFSYDRKTLTELNEVVGKLVVLDHHKTAEEELRGLDFAHFDMNKSGAVLAWEYFHPGTPVPKILTRIEDRDIWRWQYRDTAAVLASVSMAGGNFSIWDQLEADYQKAVSDGRQVVAYQNHCIERSTSDKAPWFMVDYLGFRAAVHNSTHMSSEVSAALLKRPDVDIAIGFHFDETGTPLLGFRSVNPTGPDVAVLAKQLGGGGHKHAAGAKIDHVLFYDLVADKQVTQDSINDFLFPDTYPHL